jgi:putative CocE/NonD family hydrolase
MDVHTRFEKIQVPTFIMGGWYDYYPRDAFRSFNRLRDTAGSEEMRARRRIIIGPWSHLISLGPTLGEVDYGKPSHLDVDALALRWFDYLLKDIDTGIMDEPPVTIFVMGINEWRQEHEWPLARTQYTDYYFHQDGVLNTISPGDEAPDTYTYDPDNPVPTLGGNHSICWGDAFHVIQPGPFDQREIEARDDVLVYTTAPLAEPLEVTGPITITLYASTDALDTDWTAKLIDVYPDDRAINLTEGVIRARFRESIYQPEKLLEPGEIYAYTLELLDTSNVFLPGHRIRVDLTSSNFPLWDRNPNTGHKQGADAELRVAQQTVYHEREYPTRITLPVIP